MPKNPAEQKRRGRPVKEPEPGTRVSLGLKVTPDVKRSIDAAASRSGRTQSQEAEARIERSFEEDELFPQLLRFKFGERLGSLLLQLAEASDWVGGLTAFFIRPRGQPSRSGYWFDDAYAFDQVTKAINTILEAHRPPGDTAAPMEVVNVWAAAGTPPEEVAEMGVVIAKEVLGGNTLTSVIEERQAREKKARTT